ncbi:hypothetical protein HV819_07870 [Anaerococcus sp. AGMB00486]|uniref:Phage holin n=1 Tax=Anaerococcus faecalis TaxID=2742993 RepID=A0ABX2NBG2_9FIRM|nr:hypothetical protein [Anaerococcus faecalis]NVF11894.1 hypothetical protein [Anaerococcus faecalis]
MNNIFNNLMLTILTIGLCALIKILTRQVKEYTRNNINNEKAKRAIEKALEVVTLAVNTTNQTFVKELKDKNGFGKRKAEEAFNATKKEVLDMLDKETKEILEKEFENTDKFLNSAIESKVWESKNK